MANPLFLAITSTLKEALATYRRYIDTRQEAYERKMDKRQEKALNYAEEAFDEVSKLYNFIHECMDVPKERKKDYDRIKTKIYRLRDKFNKYD